MHLKKLAVAGAAAALLSTSMLATQAYAQDSIYVPLLTYRTGPFAGSGIPIANGMHDYFAMLNGKFDGDL